MLQSRTCPLLWRASPISTSSSPAYGGLQVDSNEEDSERGEDAYARGVEHVAGGEDLLVLSDVTTDLPDVVPGLDGTLDVDGLRRELWIGPQDSDLQ